MDVTACLTCAIPAGMAGAAAGWWTVRRMTGGGPRRGGTMRTWPGPGVPHERSSNRGRRLGRARRGRRGRREPG